MSSPLRAARTGPDNSSYRHVGFLAGLTGLMKAVQHLMGTTGLIKANLKADHPEPGPTEQV